MNPRLGRAQKTGMLGLGVGRAPKTDAQLSEHRYLHIPAWMSSPLAYTAAFLYAWGQPQRLPRPRSFYLAQSLLVPLPHFAPHPHSTSPHSTSPSSIVGHKSWLLYLEPQLYLWAELLTPSML